MRTINKNPAHILNPTALVLTELQPQGQTFRFNRESGELNKKLADIIQDNDYSAEIELLPMGNAFQISGQIKTSQELTCARCAREMHYPVDLSFTELIVITEERPRAGHSGHTGQEDGGIFCNYQTSYYFDLAEFIHEQIASNEPFAPHCDKADCEAEFEEAQKKLGAAGSAGSPFDVLKNLTVRRQRD